MPAPADRPAPPPAVARAGPRSCRASTRACAAAPMARRRAGSSRSERTAAAKAAGGARLDQQAGHAVRDDVGHAALAAGDHRQRPPPAPPAAPSRRPRCRPARHRDRRRRRPPASSDGGTAPTNAHPLAERREHRLDRRPRLAVADQHQPPGQVDQPCRAPRRECGRTARFTSARIIATAQQRRDPPAGMRRRTRGRRTGAASRNGGNSRSRSAGTTGAQARQILRGHRQDQVGLPDRRAAGRIADRPPARAPACRRATPRPPRRGCAAPG